MWEPPADPRKSRKVPTREKNIFTGPCTERKKLHCHKDEWKVKVDEWRWMETNAVTGLWKLPTTGANQLPIAPLSSSPTINHPTHTDTGKKRVRIQHEPRVWNLSLSSWIGASKDWFFRIPCCTEVTPGSHAKKFHIFQLDHKNLFALIPFALIAHLRKCHHPGPCSNQPQSSPFISLSSFIPVHLNSSSIRLPAIHFLSCASAWTEMSVSGLWRV